MLLNIMINSEVYSVFMDDQYITFYTLYCYCLGSSSTAAVNISPANNVQ